MTNFETADLSDEHAGEVQVVSPIFKHFGGVHKFSGRIETVTVHQGSGLVREALAKGGSDRVLVVDADGSTYAAIGDRAAALAIDEGWVGFVINGHIRDVTGVAELPIGVVALGSCPHKSELPNVGAHGNVVRFAGVVFSPGDWIYADEDGVIVSTKPLI